jgi:DNA-binding CsgD family transcriptional regulator
VRNSYGISEPELVALSYAATGHTVAESAALLLKGSETVKSQLMWCRLKLGAANTADAVARAVSAGLIDPYPELRAA